MCFFSTKIEECEKTKRNLKLTKNPMDWISYVSLLHFNHTELLAYEFSNFFMRKTTTIRNKITSDSPNNTCTISVDADDMVNGNMLEIYLTKSWHLDPLATWLLNKCVDQLLPPITAALSLYI